MVEKVASCDNATVGGGNVVDEVACEYNDLGALEKEYQEHEGAKDANALYVQYNADTTASSGEYTKGLRPTSVRPPNARLVHLTYGASGGDADSLNRLDAIQADSGGSPGDTLSACTYLGLGTVVVEDFQRPDARLDYYTMPILIYQDARTAERRAYDASCEEGAKIQCLKGNSRRDWITDCKRRAIAISRRPSLGRPCDYLDAVFPGERPFPRA